MFNKQKIDNTGSLKVLPLQISDLGEKAILCQGGTIMDLQVQKKFWFVNDQVQHVEGISETVPGVNNLLILFDPSKIKKSALVKKIKQFWNQNGHSHSTGQSFEIPVVYGGEQGEDLPQLAQSAGMSIDQYVEAHSCQEYTVYAIGSMPGFPYLGGLDPRLASPRRTVPRKKVIAGSVIIGGAQAGIQARTSPSGWHIIGMADIELFNPHNDPPALFSPGDKLRFVIKDIIYD